MAGTLKKIECDPKCGFMVRSHDEGEVVKLAMKHARKAHGMDVSEKEARGMIEDA